MAAVEDRVKAAHDHRVSEVPQATSASSSTSSRDARVLDLVGPDDLRHQQRVHAARPRRGGPHRGCPRRSVSARCVRARSRARARTPSLHRSRGDGGRRLVRCGQSHSPQPTGWLSWLYALPVLRQREPRGGPVLRLVRSRVGGARGRAEAAGRGAAPVRRPGRALADGRYRVRSFLGQGGRKRVYLADDTAADREVAVALFDTEDVAAAVQARAKREAQAMRKLGDHPHVVSVLDTGEEDGNPFIVSEYMPGGDVEALLAAEGGSLAGRAGGGDRRRRHPRARARPRPRHRPPRPEARQRLARRRRRRPARRLRPGDDRGPLAGQRRHPGRHRRLPAARAGPRRGRRPRERPLLARRPALRDADRAAALRGRRRGLDHQPAPARRPGAALAPQPRGPRGARPRGARAAGQARGGPARRRRRGARSPSRPPCGGARNRGGRRAGGQPARPPRRRGLRRPRARDRADARGRRRRRWRAAAGCCCWSGEPGIGKTRAAEELATYARVSGARVYWGRCREDEGAPAYWPWVQAIRELVRDADPVAMAWQMGAGAAEIAQLVPEVGRAPGHRAGRAGRERGGALPPVRLGDELPGRGGARPADGAGPRRPALGRRALAAAAQVCRRPRSAPRGSADRGHLPRRRAWPPPPARAGARASSAGAASPSRASRRTRSSATSR